MVHQFFVFLFCSLSLSGFAQDERYFRQILSGDLPGMGKHTFSVDQDQLNLDGALYYLDLNNDGIEEVIQPRKRNGIDCIEIKDSSFRVIFSAKLLAMGGNSHIYKIRLVHISSKVKVLILFLDEGITRGKRIESTGRIFLIPIEDNNLNGLKITEGPNHFQEKEAQREQYFRRDYAVEVRDINDDGVRDVLISYGHIQRILIYKSDGEWLKL